nr:MAG TPA: hypothetical protein [Caudoviricetes sp.]
MYRLIIYKIRVFKRATKVHYFSKIPKLHL